MVNMLKMDMYRLFKSRTFKIVLIVVVLLNLLVGPIDRIAYHFLVKKSTAENPVIWQDKVFFADSLTSPLYFFDNIMTLLSIVWFSHADLGHGYIKNIAGQLPKKGYTVISKYIVVGIQNFFLMLAAAVAQIVGYIPFSKIDLTTSISDGVGYFWLKWLLIMAISAIILLFSSGLKSKNAATTAAVLMGGILRFTYDLFNFFLKKIPVDALKDFDLADYAPDALFSQDEPPIARSLIVSAAFIVVLTTVTVRIFDKKDVN